METKRLLCVYPSLQHIQDYLAIRNSECVLQYNPLRHITKEEAILEIEKMIRLNDAYFIIEKKSQQMIGVIHMSQDSMRYKANSIELSYYLHADFHRQGYMYEALQEVITQLLPLYNCISARCFASNVASNQLLLKLGFIQEGHLKQAVYCQGIVHDDHLYALHKPTKEHV